MFKGSTLSEEFNIAVVQKLILRVEADPDVPGTDGMFQCLIYGKDLGTDAHSDQDSPSLTQQ